MDMTAPITHISVAPLTQHIAEIQSFLTAARERGTAATTTEAYRTLLQSMTDRTVAWAAPSPICSDPDAVRGFHAEFLHDIAERRGQVLIGRKSLSEIVSTALSLNPGSPRSSLTM
jgi:hypothetical protein